jgi:TatD DNase family protein
MNGLVDTHCHVMDSAFESDRPAVLARARQAGVHALVLVGYDLQTSRAAIDLARTLPWTVAAVGIHPNAAGAASEADFEAIAALAHDPLVVAVGETGLDNFRKRTPPERQRAALEWHLQLAEALNLPVIIHNRDADTDIVEMLEASARRRPLDQPPGVLHCFSSTNPDYLERMLAAGYAVSFAGPLTYKSAADLRAMALRVPHDRLLVETDCPYLPPASQRGRRNEPAFLVETATYLAEVVQVPHHELVAQLWSNSVRVFPSLAHRAQQEVA